MTHHDTAAIRALARRLESSASTLGSTESSASGKILDLNGDMCSDTNTEIANAADKLKGELQSIQKGLSKCAEILYAYAKELDLADQKAQSLIKSN